MRGSLKACLRWAGPIALLISTSASAQAPAGRTDAVSDVAFMGYVGEGLFWMDLRMSSSDGPVTGTYFYLKHGKELKLTGTRKDSNLVLEERYNNKVTGIFKIEYQDPGIDEPKLQGTWNKPGKAATTNVSAFRTNPAYKVCAKINVDGLRMASGKSFGEELDERPMQTEEDREGRGGGRNYDIASCGRGFFSTGYGYSYFWGGRADPETPTHYQTFDLRTQQEVALEDQIQPDKMARFEAEVRKRLKVTEQAQSGLGYYLKDQTVMAGYSEFPDPESNHLIEVFTELPLPVLARYLKKDSVLLRLMPDHKGSAPPGSAPKP
jgi:hypothetical protein